jgi:dTDP-4-dehydrorhamnose 3,5-epimerase-like enzyme
MKVEKFYFDIRGDEKGNLISLEENKNIPFNLKRVYYIFNTKDKVRRGFHAHKALDQILICISGSCEILLDDGKEKQTIFLSKPNEGLLVKRMIWHEMFNFSSYCVLLVLAHEYYDESDYIRNYQEFIKITKS